MFPQHNTCKSNQCSQKNILQNLISSIKEYIYKVYKVLQLSVIKEYLYKETCIRYSLAIKDQKCYWKFDYPTVTKELHAIFSLKTIPVLSEVTFLQRNLWSGWKMVSNLIQAMHKPEDEIVFQLHSKSIKAGLK